MLLVGLAAGSAGGYFYAMLQQPAVEPAVIENSTEQTSAETDVNTNAQAEASTSPLDTVQTNPFQ